MITTLNPSSLAWRGLASVVFGIVALAWPTITLGALTLLFGFYAIADGGIALVIAAQRGKRPHRWLLVVDGLIGIAAGVLTLVWPGLTLLLLVLMIGVRSILSGGAQIGAAVRLRKVMPMPVLYGLGGLATIALGIVALLYPGITALALVSVLAVYSLFFGTMLITLGAVSWRYFLAGGGGAPGGAAGGGLPGAGGTGIRSY